MLTFKQFVEANRGTIKIDESKQSIVLKGKVSKAQLMEYIKTAIAGVREKKNNG